MCWCDARRQEARQARPWRPRGAGCEGWRPACRPTSGRATGHALARPCLPRWLCLQALDAGSQRCVGQTAGETKAMKFGGKIGCTGGRIRRTEGVQEGQCAMGVRQLVEVGLSAAGVGSGPWGCRSGAGTFDGRSHGRRCGGAEEGTPQAPPPAARAARSAVPPGRERSTRRTRRTSAAPGRSRCSRRSTVGSVRLAAGSRPNTWCRSEHWSTAKRGIAQEGDRLEAC